MDDDNIYACKIFDYNEKSVLRIMPCRMFSSWLYGLDLRFLV
jgi:hypothetical protein